MGLRRKKSLIDQAADYVEGMIPQLESAVASARDKALPIITDARDKAGPMIADARDRATPILAEGAAIAADKASIASAIAAEKASIASTLAAEKAAAGRELAAAKLAEIKGEPAPKKGGKLKRLLLLGGLLALGGAVFKKLREGQASDNWQSSYVPSPPPTPAGPAADPADAAGEVTDDPGGSSPDEMMADAAESPHAATTPDDPADVVTLDEDAAKKS